MEMEEKYPIMIDGKLMGEMKISREGPMTVFDADCRMREGIIRLSAYGGGREGYLGVMMPSGERLRLKKSLSPNAMRSMPDPIEEIGLSGRGKDASNEKGDSDKSPKPDAIYAYESKREEPKSENRIEKEASMDETSKADSKEKDEIENKDEAVKPNVKGEAENKDEAVKPNVKGEAENKDEAAKPNKKGVTESEEEQLKPDENGAVKSETETEKTGEKIFAQVEAEPAKSKSKEALETEQDLKNGTKDAPEPQNETLKAGKKDKSKLFSKSQDDKDWESSGSKMEIPEDIYWYCSPDGALVCFDGENSLIALPVGDPRIPSNISPVKKTIEGKRYHVYKTENGRIMQ